MLRGPGSRALLRQSSLLTSANLRTSTNQAGRVLSLVRPFSAQASKRQEAVQATRGHAVSNPTLANIEKRWEAMPPQEQAELWMALRDRMTVDWNELTMQEKKASYWIAFGPHGPRALPDPNETWHVIRMVIALIALSAAIFGTSRYFAGQPPKTMTQEWQEMTNEYLKAQKSEAITGVSSLGYKGKGMVQSPPKGMRPGENDDKGSGE